MNEMRTACRNLMTLIGPLDGRRHGLYMSRGRQCKIVALTQRMWESRRNRPVQRLTAMVLA